MGRQGDPKSVKDHKGCKFGHGLLNAQRELSVEVFHFSIIPMEQKEQAKAAGIIRRPRCKQEWG
jgi:hypothetical protein